MYPDIKRLILMLIRALSLDGDTILHWLLHFDSQHARALTPLENDQRTTTAQDYQPWRTLLPGSGLVACRCCKKTKLLSEPEECPVREKRPDDLSLDHTARPKMRVTLRQHRWTGSHDHRPPWSCMLRMSRQTSNKFVIRSPSNRS